MSSDTLKLKFCDVPGSPTMFHESMQCCVGTIPCAMAFVYLFLILFAFFLMGVLTMCVLISHI
jgi:hypothetical protein